MTRTVKMRVYVQRANGSTATIKQDVSIEDEAVTGYTPADTFGDFIEEHIEDADTILEASYTLWRDPSEFSESRSGGSRYPASGDKK